MLTIWLVAEFDGVEVFSNIDDFAGSQHGVVQMVQATVQAISILPTRQLFGEFEETEGKLHRLVSLRWSIGEADWSVELRSTGVVDIRCQCRIIRRPVSDSQITSTPIISLGSSSYSDGYGAACGISEFLEARFYGVVRLRFEPLRPAVELDTT